MSRATGDVRELVRRGLRVPRGGYAARRAGQLAGLPERTIYEWAHSGVFVPDHHGAHPMRWSYRDLIYLRLLTRLRVHGMGRDEAAHRVRLVRGLAADDRVDLAEVRLTDRGLMLPGETHDRLTGEAVLTLADMTDRFDLLGPIEGISNRRMWGPNLVTPTEHTFMSPWVLAGEPCIEGTRVPTASLLALVELRGMTFDDVVVLYPQLTAAHVGEAVDLERRVRRRAAP